MDLSFKEQMNVMAKDQNGVHVSAKEKSAATSSLRRDLSPEEIKMQQKSAFNLDIKLPVEELQSVALQWQKKGHMHACDALISRLLVLEFEKPSVRAAQKPAEDQHAVVDADTDIPVTQEKQKKNKESKSLSVMSAILEVALEKNALINWPRLELTRIAFLKKLIKRSSQHLEVSRLALAVDDWTQKALKKAKPKYAKGSAMAANQQSIFFNAINLGLLRAHITYKKDEVTEEKNMYYHASKEEEALYHDAAMLDIANYEALEIEFALASPAVTAEGKKVKPAKKKALRL